VPLRRVNQAFVIATSTKVDVSGVTVPENVNDDYFAKEKTASKKTKEEKFFAQSAAVRICFFCRFLFGRTWASLVVAVTGRGHCLVSLLPAGRAVACVPPSREGTVG
jgi:hypothetical protein